MIPDLPLEKHLTKEISYFISFLKDFGFNGDISSNLADRICLSTDNSVYQACPQVVIFPKVEQDIINMMKVSTKPRFKFIKFSPRGGGFSLGDFFINLTTGINLSDLYLNYLISNVLFLRLLI